MEKFIDKYYSDIMTLMYYAGMGRCPSYTAIQDFVLMNTELMNLLNSEGGK